MPIVRRLLLASLATGLAGGIAAAQPVPATRLRGTIAAVSGDTITLATREGTQLDVALRPDTVVTQVVPARLDDIKPGSFIGTTALPQQDGSLMAVEVHVFPESMRGTGEGHRPWDLQPQSTMTNGTVGDVAGTSGRTLHVKYKGGEQNVVVPPEAAIVTYEPGSRALLVPGAKVFVLATKSAEGALAAVRIGVGKDGLKPPM
jgi:hypothetical protein